MKRFSLSSLLATLALFIGVTSLNSASVMFYHQPIIPEEMKKYKN